MTTALWVLFLTALTAVAGALLVLGVRLLAADLRPGWSECERATATVVGHRVNSAGDGVFYYPIARFAAGGAEWEVVSLIGHNRPPYRAGQAVTVYHPRGRPGEARFERFGVWWAWLVMAVVGAGFMFGAVGALLGVFSG